MEWVEVIEQTNEYIKVKYYPEQTEPIGEFGIVTYFLSSDEWTFDKIADDYSRSYAMHACNFVRSPYKNGEEICLGGMVAWY